MKQIYREIGATIVRMMEKEVAAKIEYEKAYKAFEQHNRVVEYWEEEYKHEGEAVGGELDAAYDSNHELWEVQSIAGDKLDKICGALILLREAAELVKKIEGI